MGNTMGKKQVPCRAVERSTAPLALPRPAHRELTMATQLWTGRARHCRRMHSAPMSCMEGSAEAKRVIRGRAKMARRTAMSPEPSRDVRAANR